MTLVSGNIRCMWIFAGFLLAGASNDSGVVDDGNFLAIEVATSSNISEIRPAILCGDMLALVGWWLIAKWMTLNDLEWLFHVKIRFRPSLLDSEHLTFKNNCVKSHKHRPMLSAVEMYSQCLWLYSFWQYKSFLDIRKRFSDYCRQAGVGWLKSAEWIKFCRICSSPDAISS